MFCSNGIFSENYWRSTLPFFLPYRCLTYKAAIVYQFPCLRTIFWWWLLHCWDDLVGIFLAIFSNIFFFFLFSSEMMVSRLNLTKLMYCNCQYCFQPLIFLLLLLFDPWESESDFSSLDSRSESRSIVWLHLERSDDSIDCWDIINYKRGTNLFLFISNRGHEIYRKLYS